MSFTQPERMCVGCRNRAPKAQLTRLGLSPEGHVTVDISGTMPGRGAYVHRTPECVAALHERALARALRTGVGRDEVGKLRNELEEQRGES